MRRFTLLCFCKFLPFFDFDVITITNKSVGIEFSIVFNKEVVSIRFETANLVISLYCRWFLLCYCLDGLDYCFDIPFPIVTGPITLTSIGIVSTFMFFRDSFISWGPKVHGIWGISLKRIHKNMIHSGEGIDGYHQRNAKLFYRIEHSGIG